MRSAVAFIAAPYGFGPSSKAIAISSHLPRLIERVFFGDGPPFEMAQRSGEFSSCVRLDFGAPDHRAPDLLAAFQVLVFVNSTRFIPAPRTNGSIILVDTLAWLRRSRPSSADSLTAYFAQRFFDHPFAAELVSMENFHPIGPIVPKAISEARSRLDPSASISHASPVIHCGGLCSPAMCSGADIGFATQMFASAARNKEPLRVVLPRHLHDHFLNRVPAGVTLIDCSPLDVDQHVLGSTYSLTTSGIEFTYESILLGVPTLFLPPFNATQYLQLEHHQAAHPDSIPFTLSTGAPRNLDFASLDQATAQIQREGMQGVWETQFNQVAAFLAGRASVPSCSSVLRQLRQHQEAAIDGIGCDGARVVAAHAASCLCPPQAVP